MTAKFFMFDLFINWGWRIITLTRIEILNSSSIGFLCESIISCIHDNSGLSWISQGISKHTNDSRWKESRFIHHNPKYILCTWRLSHRSIIFIPTERGFTGYLILFIKYKFQNIDTIFDIIFGNVIFRVRKVHYVKFIENWSSFSRSFFKRNRQYSLLSKISSNSFVINLNFHFEKLFTHTMFSRSMEHNFISLESLLGIIVT